MSGIMVAGGAFVQRSDGGRNKFPHNENGRFRVHRYPSQRPLEHETDAHGLPVGASRLPLQLAASPSSSPRRAAAAPPLPGGERVRLLR
jgi:hypothetical protein